MATAGAISHWPEDDDGGESLREDDDPITAFPRETQPPAASDEEPVVVEREVLDAPPGEEPAVMQREVSDAPPDGEPAGVEREVSDADTASEPDDEAPLAGRRRPLGDDAFEPKDADDGLVAGSVWATAAQAQAAHAKRARVDGTASGGSSSPVAAEHTPSETVAPADATADTLTEPGALEELDVSGSDDEEKAEVKAEAKDETHRRHAAALAETAVRHVAGLERPGRVVLRLSQLTHISLVRIAGRDKEAALVMPKEAEALRGADHLVLVNDLGDLPLTPHVLQQRHLGAGEAPVVRRLFEARPPDYRRPERMPLDPDTMARFYAHAYGFVAPFPRAGVVTAAYRMERDAALGRGGRPQARAVTVLYGHHPIARHGPGAVEEVQGHILVPVDTARVDAAPPRVPLPQGDAQCVVSLRRPDDLALEPIVRQLFHGAMEELRQRHASLDHVVVEYLPVPPSAFFGPCPLATDAMHFVTQTRGQGDGDVVGTADLLDLLRQPPAPPRATVSLLGMGIPYVPRSARYNVRVSADYTSLFLPQFDDPAFRAETLFARDLSKRTNHPRVAPLAELARWLAVCPVVDRYALPADEEPCVNYFDRITALLLPSMAVDGSPLHRGANALDQLLVTHSALLRLSFEVSWPDATRYPDGVGGVNRPVQNEQDDGRALQELLPELRKEQDRVDRLLHNKPRPPHFLGHAGLHAACTRAHYLWFRLLPLALRPLAYGWLQLHLHASLAWQVDEIHVPVLSFGLRNAADVGLTRFRAQFLIAVWQLFRTTRDFRSDQMRFVISATGPLGPAERWVFGGAPRGEVRYVQRDAHSLTQRTFRLWDSETPTLETPRPDPTFLFRQFHFDGDAPALDPGPDAERPRWDLPYRAEHVAEPVATPRPPEPAVAPPAYHVAGGSDARGRRPATPPPEPSLEALEQQLAEASLETPF